MTQTTDAPQTDTDTDVETINPNKAHLFDQTAVRHSRFNRRQYIEALNLLDLLDEELEEEDQE